MARDHEKPKSVIASCADYDEKEGEDILGSRNVANVSAKRSSGSLVTGGGFDKEVSVQISDLTSDSGHSSHTQATADSANTKKSS
jgi:hypothetical protein